MSFLDSSIAPYLVLLSLVGILLGFFRRSLLRVVIILVLEILLFALFPELLVKLANLVGMIRNAIL